MCAPPAAFTHATHLHLHFYAPSLTLLLITFLHLLPLMSAPPSSPTHCSATPCHAIPYVARRVAARPDHSACARRLPPPTYSPYHPYATHRIHPPVHRLTLLALSPNPSLSCDEYICLLVARFLHTPATFSVLYSGHAGGSFPRAHAHAHARGRVLPLALHLFQAPPPPHRSSLYIRGLLPLHSLYFYSPPVE